MAKIRSNWTYEPDPKDYAAAHDYLSLLLPENAVRDAIRSLELSSTIKRRADDLMRASGEALLPADDPKVAQQLKKLKRGKLLSPVLLLRGELREGARLTIADGYHRVSASYTLDTEAAIPCRMVELPQ